MTLISGTEITKQIGRTPLIELKTFSSRNIRIYAKLEWYNPFGSVKDRAAYWMIKDAERRGLLKKDKSVIIEPSSGNTGIALTGIASSLGYKVEIVIPEKVSNETKSILRLLGATLHETSDDLCPRVGAGTDQSIALAKAIAKPRPDLYFMPNQYENDANFQAHYETTGPEIWEQTEGKITHFITGCGTGGTITGIANYLKEKRKEIKIVAVQAQRNHLLQGLRNFEESSMPELFKRREHLVDQWITSTNENSFRMMKKLAMEENLLVGPSSGAVLSGVMEMLDNSDIDRCIIVGVFADDGRKFKSLYTEQGILTEEQFNNVERKAHYLPDLSYRMVR
jgi:cysteine synthase B